MAWRMAAPFSTPFLNTMEHYISLDLAGHPLICKLNHSGTARRFGPFAAPCAPEEDALSLSEEQLTQARLCYPPEADDSVVEYNELVSAVSDALLPRGACLFHGVAFLWRGRAWIFTAPSGTGKTTQFLLWKHCFGEEIRMLNGDKPLLGIHTDGSVWAYPSPWVGKEGMYCLESAPLGGIICLAQSRGNQIRRLSIRESVDRIYGQFLYSADTAEQVRRVCALEDRILRSVPVWLLENRGDAASARLTHDTILKGSEKDAL